MKKIFWRWAAALLLPLLLTAEGPWDAWRKGYNAFEKGVRLKESGEYQRARAAFREAMMYYETVRKERPDWNQRVIQSRISDSDKAIKEIDQLLTSSQLSSATGVTPAELTRPAAPEESRPASAVKADSMVSQAEYDRQALESERYRKRLLDALVELEDLRRELARNKARSEEIGNLLRESRVAKERYTLLQKRYAELEKQLKKPNSRISELESKLLELQLSLDLEKKRAASWEAKWKKADEEALRQAGLFRAANERVTAAQQEIEKLTAAAAELRRARDASADLNGKREELLTRRAAELRDKEKEVRALQKELQQARQNVDSLRRGVVSQEGVASNLIEENKKLQAALNEASGAKTAAENRVNELSGRLHDLQQELLQLREREQQMTARIERSAAELATARKDLDRERAGAKFTRSEINSWRARCTKLENEVKSWSERAVAFEKRVQNITSHNIDALEAADREKKRLEGEIAALTERFAVLQARGEQLEGLRKQAEARQLEEHKQLTVLTKKLRASEDAAVRSAKELEAQKKNCARLQAQLQKQHDPAGKQRLDAALRRLQELNGNFQALRSENAKLKADLAAMERRNSEFQAAQKQAGSLSSMQKNLLALQQENQALRDRLLAARNQLQSLKQQLLAGRNAVPPTVAGSTPPPPPKRLVSTSVRELISAALKAEKEEKYALAIWNYEAVLEQDPSHAEAAMRLGLLQLRRQAFEAAEKYLAIARSAGVNTPAVRIAHAEALNGLRKYGNALSVLEPLLADNAAPSAELALTAAIADLGAGKTAPAEKLLRGVVTRYPDRGALKKELARILVRTNRSSEALELYRRAKELGETPDGELEKALGKLFEERRELNNFMAEAAREAEKNNDWISAAWYYRQMLDQEKNSAVLAAHLAFSLLQSGNPPAAIEVLTLNAAPSAAGSLIRALARYRSGDAANAAKDAAAVHALNHGAPLVLEEPEWLALKRALAQAVEKPAPGMTAATAALKKAYR